MPLLRHKGMWLKPTIKEEKFYAVGQEVSWLFHSFYTQKYIG